MKRKDFLKINSFWILPFFITKKDVERILEEIKKEVCEDLEIDLSFDDDLSIEELNKKFLNLKSPTNVLSFPEEKGSGSIMISLETVFRESFLYNQPLEEHLIRILIHGILHILNIDHSPYMFELTEKLVEKSKTILYRSY